MLPIPNPQNLFLEFVTDKIKILELPFWDFGYRPPSPQRVWANSQYFLSLPPPCARAIFLDFPFTLGDPPTTFSHYKQKVTVTQNAPGAEWVLSEAGPAG